MIKAIYFVFILACTHTLVAQTSASSFNFIDYQLSFPKVNDALKAKEDTLKKQFEEKKLKWPAKYLYIRSFKYDSKMEVWVKQERDDVYRLFKTYKVCAMAGSLGPKRMEGDYQVPEGFYYINEFNPKSEFHLSLGLNYPNASDKLLSDSLQPGGDIYIHGSCVTTGCIPITNEQIEELYVLAALAKNQGQDFIPVHIFPISYQNNKSVDYLTKYIKQFPEYKDLTDRMRDVYYYFEKNKALPVILTNAQGEYILGEPFVVSTEAPKPAERKIVKKKEATPVAFDEKELVTSVNKLPVYPGGSEGFQTFLNTLSKDLAKLLPEEQAKTFITVEYIVTKEGKIILPNVLKGATNEMNNLIIERFEAMPHWSPAIRLEKAVPIKLKQTIYVE